jgi:hypothetical protein
MFFFLYVMLCLLCTEGGLLGAGLGAAGVLVGQQVLNPCGRRRRQVCHSMCFPYSK